MKKFDEKTASSDELYEWCKKEYNSNSLISKMLITRFYKVIDKILQKIRPSISKTLEVGCGAGESTMRLQNILSGINFDATEYDIRYIEAAQKRGLPINISQENVYSLKQESLSYDLIIMLEVLEHLEDISLALSELFRVSSKYVIISVPNEPFWRIGNFIRGKYISDFGNTPGHINHFSKHKLREILLPFSTKMTFYFSFPWIILLAEKINVAR